MKIIQHIIKDKIMLTDRNLTRAALSTCGRAKTKFLSLLLKPDAVSMTDYHWPTFLRAIHRVLA